jgi:hypothetical protein
MGIFPLGRLAGLKVVLIPLLLHLASLIFVIVADARVFTFGVGPMQLHYERAEREKAPGTGAVPSRHPKDLKPHTQRTTRYPEPEPDLGSSTPDSTAISDQACAPCDGHSRYPEVSSTVGSSDSRSAGTAEDE